MIEFRRRQELVPLHTEVPSLLNLQKNLSEQAGGHFGTPTALCNAEMGQVHAAETVNEVFHHRNLGLTAILEDLDCHMNRLIKRVLET